MTDQAFKDGPDPMGPPVPGSTTSSAPNAATSPLGRSNLPTRFGDKVVSFTLPRIDGEKPKGDDQPSGSAATASIGGRDWSSAIDLIHEASEAIRISHERTVELENQLEQVMAQATSEVQRLNAQIAAGDLKLATTEERLRATEARAAEAEGWLIRLHDAIFSAFTNKPRDASAEAGMTSEEPASN